MNVCYLSAEADPYAKTGGLGDVGGVLPVKLAEAGHDVKLFVPHYKKLHDYLKKNKIKSKTIFELNIAMGSKYIQGTVEHSPHPWGNVDVYSLRCDELFMREGLYSDEGGGEYGDNFKRFIFFSKAALSSIEQLFFSENYRPDILHLHDWHSAAAAFIAKLNLSQSKPFSSVAVVYTIHNFMYQGAFPATDYALMNMPWEHFNGDNIEHFGSINLMKAGISFCDEFSTVSPSYAEEIKTKYYGAGLDDFVRRHEGKLNGILNGADYDVWNPAADKRIPFNFDYNDLSGKEECKKRLCESFGIEYDENKSLFGFVGRLDEQKGIKLILSSFDRLIKRNAQFVFLGTGNKSYEQILCGLSAQYPNFGAKAEFNSSLASLIIAGADFFLMPSVYEPCGLTQMYSMRYGTLPVACFTGGLADTITDYYSDWENGSGVLWAPYSVNGLVRGVDMALGLYPDKDALNFIRTNAMGRRFLWEDSVSSYEGVYEKALAKVRPS